MDQAPRRIRLLGEELEEDGNDEIDTQQTTYAFIDAELRRMTGQGLPPMR